MIDKICFFTFSFAESKQSVLAYLEKIFPSNVEIFLFTPQHCKSLYKFERIKIVDTNCSKLFSFISLRKFCRKNKIQRLVNVGQLPYEGLMMLYASFLTKTDFICYHLGNPLDSFYINSLKIKLIAFWEAIISFTLSIFPKKIFMTSENLSKRVKRVLFFARKKIFFLYSTVSTSIFVPKNKLFCRRKLNLGKEDKIIIFVGRIGYLKGSDILIGLIRKNPDKKFILMGRIVDDGLEQKIKKYNFKNLILLPSNKSQEELIDYYNASDLCFFPSRIEGTPLVPREAMSCGIPSIVSKIPSTESISAAIRVPINLDKMHKALNDFFNLSDLQKKEISNKSRKFIIDNFDDSVWKDEFVTLFLNHFL